MVFSSYVFLFYFLPLCLALYYAVPRRAKHLILTLASYVFYGWANPLFTVLLLTSTIIDYVSGLVIQREHTHNRDAWNDGDAHRNVGGPRATPIARIALVTSLCANLGLLGFFKYFNLGAESYDALVAGIGLPSLQLDTALRVTLPLGISFYTFQSVSYTIDVFRGRVSAIRSFIDFACFVSMFPQLVAGPIIRFSEVADQLRTRSHTATKFARGIAFFSMGLVKKVLLANPCSVHAPAQATRRSSPAGWS